MIVPAIGITGTASLTRMPAAPPCPANQPIGLYVIKPKRA